MNTKRVAKVVQAQADVRRCGRELDKAIRAAVGALSRFNAAMVRQKRAEEAERRAAARRNRKDES